MFRPVRWRSEKNRVKAVFKLNFHATQVLHSGVDALVLSITPGEIGKPTMRLEQATVRDGICRWENPVYETVKFIQDPKTGKFSERIYHFSLSTGLSKSSSIGEVSINLADYAEAPKPSTVSLPIKNSHCDAVLNVSIQRLQENNDPREKKEYEDAKLKSHDRSLRNYFSHGDADEITKSSSSEDISAKAVINRAELSANSRTSSESDITVSSSDSSSGLETSPELGQSNTNIHPSTNGFLSSMRHTLEPPKPAVNASTSMDDLRQRSNWDWSADLERCSSADDSINCLLKEERDASPVEIEGLKAELATLARQVDVSDLELQTLRKQIVKETKRSQELSKEIITLKEERDAFKTERDKLRSFHKRVDETKMRNRSQLESGDLRTFVEEIRQELNYEKDLNANLRLQLQKMQESNSELVLAVQDLEEMLDKKNKEMLNISIKCEQSKSSPKCETDSDRGQKALEDLVKEHSNSKVTDLLEKKIIDLYGEIEMYSRDKDELEMQMEQLALDYEILKQENHVIAYKLQQSQLHEQLKMQYECSSPPAATNDIEIHIENLENQLKKQSEDFSDSLATIKDLEAHIRRLEEELQKQAQGFETDLEAVTRDKVEQEQRAIQAEESLRKTRLKNASSAEKLQEEFRRLSMQMTSTFDANEKASIRALAEASELHAQKSLLEEMLHKVKEELQSVKTESEVKLTETSDQVYSLKVQIQQLLLESEDKNKQLENQKQHEEQVSRDFSEEIRILKGENGRLKSEISCIREQVEQKEIIKTDFEIMKKSVEEYETLLRRGTAEREELLNKLGLLKKEEERSLDELNRMRHLKDENETVARTLQSELEAARAQQSDMKHSLLENEAEKEKLRQQVFQLKGELKRKDDSLTNNEKKFKDGNGRTQLSDATKTIPKNKKVASSPQNSKEMASLREKIKMLEGVIKSRESALETLATSVRVKEKELQTKIEELENKVEESNRTIALRKVEEDKSNTTANDISGEGRSTVEDLNVTARVSEQDGVALIVKSNVTFPAKEAETYIVDGDSNLGDILTELSSLKERNKSMESELKELRGRYSEMSLKFAEVEGERQKLVMTVRNLKSTQKG